MIFHTLPLFQNKMPKRIIVFLCLLYSYSNIWNSSLFRLLFQCLSIFINLRMPISPFVICRDMFYQCCFSGQYKAPVELEISCSHFDFWSQYCVFYHDYFSHNTNFHSLRFFWSSFICTISLTFSKGFVPL